MTYLEVPGASLYYESVGEGPLLLCISGADGSCEIWRGFQQCFEEQVQVVCYDRRGFSRSYLNGAQDYEHRLHTDADDAAALIKHLSKEPATVLGSSSGACVSLQLVTRHPDVIRTLIPYEPPAARLLPDFEDFFAFKQDVYNTYRASGPEPALKKFAKGIKIRGDETALMQGFNPRNGPYIFSNTQYWFEREALCHVKDHPSLEELRPFKEKLLLVNGELSDPEAPQYRTNVVLSKGFGLELVHLPGEHVGFASHAKEFAAKLVEALKKKDGYYEKV